MEDLKKLKKRLIYVAKYVENPNDKLLIKNSLLDVVAKISDVSRMHKHGYFPNCQKFNDFYNGIYVSSLENTESLPEPPTIESLMVKKQELNCDDSIDGNDNSVKYCEIETENKLQNDEKDIKNELVPETNLENSSNINNKALYQSDLKNLEIINSEKKEEKISKVLSESDSNNNYVNEAESHTDSQPFSKESSNFDMELDCSENVIAQKDQNPDRINEEKAENNFMDINDSKYLPLNDELVENDRLISKKLQENMINNSSTLKVSEIISTSQNLKHDEIEIEPESQEITPKSNEIKDKSLKNDRNFEESGALVTNEKTAPDTNESSKDILDGKEDSASNTSSAQCTSKLNDSDKKDEKLSQKKIPSVKKNVLFDHYTPSKYPLIYASLL
ncbi:hypothetical protein AYI69_g7837 [Smittium culicis]|uniref:Uncharacterized protein n=1 Tax=Smittium culicis TaxID=133412 RepID=A0A1R1XP76_9FUNG|nr:hypothetical protein AYI69_g7837 [Smittium culicis]